MMFKSANYNICIAPGIKPSFPRQGILELHA